MSFERTKTDELITNEHKNYDEFERCQWVISLDVGDTIEIKVYDKEEKEIDSKVFTAKYINCHINCQWQDKGVKKTELDVK